jgi:phosphoribosylglycinamide formyltransferase 1
MSLSLAILISGRGSNMRAIHQAIKEKKLDARIALILSDQENAAGVRYATEQGLPTTVLIKMPGEKRVEYDRRVMAFIDEKKVEVVVLAGFMRLLSPEFVHHYRGRLVNIHPSLLPKYPGLHAQRQALQGGEKNSGCTVHFVDEGCDSGPIIAQRSVPILPGDDESTLSDRILEQEHQLYSQVLQMIAEGKVKLEGDKVRIV